MDQPTQPVPETASSSVSRIFSNRRALIIIVAALVAVLALTVVLLPQLPRNIANAITFRDSHILKSSSEGTALYQFGFMGLKESSPAISGTLVDFAHEGKVSAAIVRTEEGTVDVVRVGKEPQVLVSDAQEKLGVAVAPNGKWIMYSAFSGTPEELGTRALWSVYLYDLETGETRMLGVGYESQFFSRDGKIFALFLSPEGVTVADLDAMTSFTTNMSVPSEAGNLAAVAPNGSHIVMHDERTDEWVLYTVKEVQPVLKIEPAVTFVSKETVPVYLGSSVYGMVRTDTGTTLEQVNLQDGTNAKTVHTFPNDGARYQLIP